MYLDDGLICGGAERVARRLLAHWVDNGHDVFLVARHPPEEGFYPLPARVKGMSLQEASNTASVESSTLSAFPRRLLRLPGLASLRALVRLGYEASQLRRVLRRIDPDVCVSFLTPANVKLLLAATGLRPGKVVSERNDTRNYKYPRIWRVLRRLLYRKADRVTANLPASVEDMARYVPRARISYAPNPVDLPEANVLADPYRSRRILCVGRLVPYKRHHLLLKAFSDCSHELAEWHLDIVGEGPLRSDLEREIEALGLDGRVEMQGERHDVEYFYRNGAVFVLPSIVEGTPNALLEAMAHGLPCIVSDSVSGAADYIDSGVNGFSFVADASDSLAERIVSLAGSPDLRKAMGQRARERMQMLSAGSPFAIWDEVVGQAAPRTAQRAAS